MGKLNIEQIEEMIRAEEDPEALGKKLKAMIEEAHPVAAFEDGEEMAMHEFVARFKRAYCEGNETRFWQSTVIVVVGRGDLRGEAGIRIIAKA